MNPSDEPVDRRPASSASRSISSRNIQFFDTTGRTLVHPRSYTLQRFQKRIIQTALLNNTLISLPPGLGKLYIAAVITLNFHRWLLNSKIVILSQTRSYLTDLLNAFNDYTSISKDVYCELPNNAARKDYGSACKRPILLTSPQKLVELISENIFRTQSVVLLLVFESSKIVKCQEYQQILDALSEYQYRTLVFIDPIGFNQKSIRQVVEHFSISKFQVKNCDSEDIRECTYSSKIDHAVVEISKPISNMKDTFFAVLEKYSRNLKEAKIISGNVTTLTRLQLLKTREKLKKNPPVNMPQAQRDNLMNSLTICAFLCQGLELLHNWGIRIFYEYLFDDDKDTDVKTLIAKDEDLKSQMKDLHRYLEFSTTKIDTKPSLLVHPKLIRLKEIVTQRCERGETDGSKTRIIVICPVQLVVDEIERLFRNLPETIQYHCIKTNATCLANEPDHKEIMKTFMEGVISVLVLSNVVDEVLEVEASLIISLDPSKNLMRTSDPRFFKGTPECLFVVTRGTELNKFEELLKETKNDQKTLEVGGIEIFLQDSPRLFPRDFDPEFECSDVTEPKRSFKNSPTQKTLHRYLKSSPDFNSSSPSLFEKMDSSLLKWATPKPKSVLSEMENSFIEDTFENPAISQTAAFDALDAVNDDLVPTLPIENKRLTETYLINPAEESSEELVFDISKAVTPSTSKSVSPEKNANKFSIWTKTSLFPSKKDKRDTPNDTKAEQDKYKPNLTKPTETEPCSVSLELGTKARSRLGFENPAISPTAAFDALDAVNDDLVPTLPIENKRLTETYLINPADESSEELVFDISKAVTPSISKSVTPEKNANKFSILTKNSLFPSKKDKRDTPNDTKAEKDKYKPNLTKPEETEPCSVSPEFGTKARSRLGNTQPPNQFVTVAEVHRDPFEDEEIKNEITRVQNETFADFLFSDSSSEDKRTSPDQPRPNITATIDYDKIEVDASEEAKSALRESFFDDLFADSDPDPDHNSHPVATTKDVHPRDSDSDIIEDSPVAKRRCKSFSSRSIESVNSAASQSQTSEQVSQRPKRRLYTSPKNTPAGKLAPKAIFNDWMSDSLDDVLTLDVVPKPRESTVKTPAPAPAPAPIPRPNESSERSISPVLFSSRTSSRDRTRISSTFNQSSSIKFDSTFNTSRKPSATASGSRSRTDVSNSLLFDDDEGVFSRNNLSEIEQAAARNHVERSKDSGFANTSKSFKEYSASTPKVGADRVRTPEPSNPRSNESTPDSIVLDNFSTPESKFSGAAAVQRRSSQGDVLRLGYTPPERVLSQRSSKQAKMTSFFKDKSIHFSDSSLSFANFSTPDGLAIKGKSPAFNSDTATSADRTNGSNASRSSTMDKLNAMSASKDTTTNPIKNSNSRFGFLRSTNNKNKNNSNNNSLFKATLKQKIESKKVEISTAFGASASFEIVDSDEEIAWMDTPPIKRCSFKEPEAPTTKTTPVSRHSTPLAIRKNVHEAASNSNTPERSPPLRKRSKLKRKIFADQFIDDEAEVSGDDECEDDDEGLNASHLEAEMASFIDDDPDRSSNMANYLKSLKSPANAAGKYYIPKLSESRLKVNVCSQVYDFDQTYEQDSFCVEEESESEANDYAPSVLTQMEWKLERKRKSKNGAQPKKRAFKRIVRNSSSPDSPQPCHTLPVQKRGNNRITNVSSSDSEAEL